MNSSTNSETTHSSQLETKEVSRYGLTISYGVKITTRPKWDRTYRDPDGTTLSQDQVNTLAAELNGGSETRRFSVDWEKTDAMIECSYVEWAALTDEEDCKSALPIEVLATPEGPIMAVVRTDAVLNDDELLLLDPCVVIFDGKAKINLLPIFNVSQTLRVSKSAIRSRQPPSEILLAMYPGFIIQNRMSRFQLKPKAAFVASPELTNSAAEID